MPPPILATKLYIPPPPPIAVRRPRLMEQLNAGLQRKLTLIAAPAGFGKTTLVSAWIHQSQKDDPSATPAEGLQPSAFSLHPFRVAWLSLDEADSDPARFLIYLVAALQTLALSRAEGLAPNASEGLAPSRVEGLATPIGAGILAALQSPRPPPPDSMLAALLNEIAALPEPFLLVLDDYHVIDSKAADAALAFIIDHLPPQIHLVITTREDPQLPLARLRARGQLTELRAADLRFTPAEAAEFLNQVMGLSLSAADIAALEDRTEGWIAGLQLAALSMRGRNDIPGFIRAFAGDNRYIVDYLIEEVLQRQPEAIRSFLLQSSILDRMNGPLCEVVTGQAEGSARLAALERGNFFVVPLDDQRQWYRYHHLFADVLLAHLLAEQPAQVPALHQRASMWYAQQGSVSDAIRHALAARDFERAAELVERSVPAMASSRQEAELLRWLRALPAELLACRPVLSVNYAGALLLNGEYAAVEARLRDAERWLNAPADTSELQAAIVSPNERSTALPSYLHQRSAQGAADRAEASGQQHSRPMVVVDAAEFRALPASIAMYRAAMALAAGDLTGTVQHARRVLDLTAEDDHLRRGSIAGLLALAYWSNGALAAGHESYTECMARLQRAGHIADTNGCALAMADIRIAQGRLRDAVRTFEQALQVSTAPGAPVLRGAADMHVGMSELLVERNDLAAARQALLSSQAMGAHNGLPQNPYRRRVAMARIQEAEADLDGALDLLAEAERLYVSDFFPNVRPLAASKARLWVAQGRLAEALDWARAQNLSSADDLTYLREYEHITLARLLLARHRSDPAGRFLPEAIGLLERLLHAADAGERMGSTIEILILLALARQLQGDLPAALAPLARALTLAEPEGYVRIFVAEGPPMAELLRRMKAEGGRMNGYIDKLLASFGEQKVVHPKPSAGVADGSSFRLSPRPELPTGLPLVEPLTERELETLRLLATDLSGPEIARRLTISLHTVRAHTKNIYSKLGVNSRREAVRRAEELDLL